MLKFLFKAILIALFLFGGWKIRFYFILALAFFLWLSHWKPKFDEAAFHLYFGLPGCGKTTALAYMFFRFQKMHKFDLFSNVQLKGAYKLDRSDFGVFDLHVDYDKSICFVDEASVYYFKRDFAKFSTKENSFHSQHRKHHVMECFFCQTWDGIDQRLRELNSHLYYVYNKNYPVIGKVIFIREIMKAFDIYTGDPKDSYQFKPFSTRWFLGRSVFRKFNTYEVEKLPDKQWIQFN